MFLLALCCHYIVDEDSTVWFNIYLFSLAVRGSVGLFCAGSSILDTCALPSQNKDHGRSSPWSEVCHHPFFFSAQVQTTHPHLPCPLASFLVLFLPSESSSHLRNIASCLWLFPLKSGNNLMFPGDSLRWRMVKISEFYPKNILVTQQE